MVCSVNNFYQRDSNIAFTMANALSKLPVSAAYRNGSHRFTITSFASG
jgi:hypothetical protein